MDALFILAGVLGVGDLVLVRIWWRERHKRRRVERCARAALRENLSLKDALERRRMVKAGPAAGRPVTVPLSASPTTIAAAVAELKRRRTAQPGGER